MSVLISVFGSLLKKPKHQLASMPPKHRVEVRLVVERCHLHLRAPAALLDDVPITLSTVLDTMTSAIGVLGGPCQGRKHGSRSGRPPNKASDAAEE